MGSKAPQPSPTDSTGTRPRKDRKGLIARVAQAALDIVHPDNEGFRERITPKPALASEGVHFFKCECGGVHYRHAGYMKAMVPFMRPGGEKRMSVENQQVMVCVACRKSYVWLNEQMYDVTDQVDMVAWEKAERELNRATGPGGEC